MSNRTIARFEIKLRADGVYDIYVNRKYIQSTGSLVSAANVIKNIDFAATDREFNFVLNDSGKQ